MDIVIDVEGLDSIISSLTTRLDNIKELNSEMNSYVTESIQNNWDSAITDKMLKYYSNVSMKTQDHINKIESLKIFLENTKENYINGDNSINNDIEKNINELSI